jgi:hypothetical protein
LKVLRVYQHDHAKAALTPFDSKDTGAVADITTAVVRHRGGQRGVRGHPVDQARYGAWASTGLIQWGQAIGTFVYTSALGDGTYAFATRAEDWMGNQEAVRAGDGDRSVHIGPYYLHHPLVCGEHRTWDPYYEPNDTREAAYGPPYQAYPDDQDDYYFFDLSSASSVTVRVEGYQAEGQLPPYRYDESGDRTQIGHDGRDLSTMVVGPQTPEAGRCHIRFYTSADRSNTDLYALKVTVG